MSACVSLGAVKVVVVVVVVVVFVINRVSFTTT